jgi:hypothetical protein
VYSGQCLTLQCEQADLGSVAVRHDDRVFPCDFGECGDGDVEIPPLSRCFGRFASPQ